MAMLAGGGGSIVSVPSPSRVASKVTFAALPQPMFTPDAEQPKSIMKPPGSRPRSSTSRTSSRRSRSVRSGSARTGSRRSSQRSTGKWTRVGNRLTQLQTLQENGALLDQRLKELNREAAALKGESVADSDLESSLLLDEETASGMSELLQAYQQEGAMLNELQAAAALGQIPGSEGTSRASRTSRGSSRTGTQLRTNFSPSTAARSPKPPTAVPTGLSLSSVSKKTVSTMMMSLLGDAEEMLNEESLRGMDTEKRQMLLEMANEAVEELVTKLEQLKSIADLTEEEFKKLDAESVILNDVCSDALQRLKNYISYKVGRGGFAPSMKSSKSFRDRDASIRKMQQESLASRSRGSGFSRSSRRSKSHAPTSRASGKSSQYRANTTNVRTYTQALKEAPSSRRSKSRRTSKSRGAGSQASISTQSRGLTTVY